MNNKLTMPDVREWLRETNRDRLWLGETLGVSKRTVDNWFSGDELPLFASHHIRRIMIEEASPSNLRFTLEQWDKIEAARRLAGYEDRTAFFTDAVIYFAQSLASRLPDYIEKLGPGAVVRHKLSKLVGDLRKEYERPRPAPEPSVSDARAKPSRKRRKA